MIYLVLNIMWKKLKFKTLMLISNLCDYIDAYIVVKGTVTVVANESDVNTMMKANESTRRCYVWKECTF